MRHDYPRVQCRKRPCGGEGRGGKNGQGRAAPPSATEEGPQLCLKPEGTTYISIPTVSQGTCQRKLLAQNHPGVGKTKSSPSGTVACQLRAPPSGEVESAPPLTGASCSPKGKPPSERLGTSLHRPQNQQTLSIHQAWNLFYIRTKVLSNVTSELDS